MKFAGRNGNDSALRRKCLNAIHNIGNASVVGAGVHKQPAANRTRNTTCKLKASKPQLTCHFGGLTKRYTSLTGNFFALVRNIYQAIGKRNYNTAIPRIAYQ